MTSNCFSRPWAESTVNLSGTSLLMDFLYSGSINPAYVDTQFPTIQRDSVEYFHVIRYQFTDISRSSVHFSFLFANHPFSQINSNNDWIVFSIMQCSSRCHHIPTSWSCTNECKSSSTTQGTLPRPLTAKSSALHSRDRSSSRSAAVLYYAACHRFTQILKRRSTNLHRLTRGTTIELCNSMLWHSILQSHSFSYIDPILPERSTIAMKSLLYQLMESRTWLHWKDVT